MPRQPWTGYHRFCPLSRSLDLLGERWTLVILQEVIGRPRRFSDLMDSLPGISSGVLTDRLRKLEAAGLVAREPGPVGGGVHYRGTDAAGDLEPALASLRQVGARLLAQTGFDCSETTYDMAYVPGVEDIGPETYVWQVDGATTTLHIDGTALTQHPGLPPPGTRPALTVTTTSEFLDRWSAGTATWDDGRASGDVHVRGSDAAWQRMQHATGYTQRPVHDP